MGAGAFKNWTTVTCLVDIITSKNVLIPEFIGTFLHNQMPFLECLLKTLEYFSSVCLVVIEWAVFSV